MKNFNVTSMLVMLMFMCITSMQAQSITPSKKYITKELNNVSNFSSIRVLGSPDVEYRQSSDSKTTVSIINSRIIKGLCMDLDKEVLQTIKKMPVWKLSEDNVDYKIIINFVLPDGCSVLEPRVSVVGIETGSQKFTVKRMNGINCGSMAVYGVHDAGGDSIFSKTITIINEDTNR